MIGYAVTKAKPACGSAESLAISGENSLPQTNSAAGPEAFSLAFCDCVAFAVQTARVPLYRRTTQRREPAQSGAAKLGRSAAFSPFLPFLSWNGRWLLLHGWCYSGFHLVLQHMIKICYR